jgi:hypothetical protein
VYDERKEGEMMLPPFPADLDQLVKDRQDRLIGVAHRGRRSRPGLRARVGGALIAAGLAIGDTQPRRSVRGSLARRSTI